MIRILGLAGSCVVGLMPVLMQPYPYLAAASAIAGLICAAALLLPSLGLALVGSVAGTVIFSVALIMSSMENTSGHALLMGIALLLVLHATHQRRFPAAAVAPAAARAPVDSLAAAILWSFVAAGAIAVLAEAASVTPIGSVRAVVAAAGCVIAMAALVHAVRPGPHGPGDGAISPDDLRRARSPADGEAARDGCRELPPRIPPG
jgi:hypothetical protein